MFLFKGWSIAWTTPFPLFSLTSSLVVVVEEEECPS